MRCRNFKDKSVTWFGSKGVQYEQLFNLTQDETEVENTFANQYIIFHFNASEETSIELYNDDTLIDSYTISTYNKDLEVQCILPSSINKIVIDTTKYNVLPQVHIFGMKIADDNYKSSLQGVETDVRQRLSIIKKELWYNIIYGLPLFEKVKSKTIIDNNVLDIITTTPDVTGIISFTSEIINHNYKANIEVKTIFGDLVLEI